MNFDNETIEDYRKIITNELAYGIFFYDWAIRQEIERHISTQLFQSPESMKQTTLKLLSHYVEKSKTKSIIGFTESDPALTTLSTWVAHQNEIPFYSYNLEDKGAFSQFVEPAKTPCSLIIPYATNDMQVNEVIALFTKQQIPIKQVISLIEEHPIHVDLLTKNTEYVKITDWNAIKNKILTFKNLTNEKMTELLEFLK